MKASESSELSLSKGLFIRSFIHSFIHSIKVTQQGTNTPLPSSRGDRQ